MFDFGFSELLMIAVVALVVIGPERLPGVARTVGRFAGRLQRYVHDIKRDFNREVEFEEIKRLQHEMETTVQSMQESMRMVETTLQQETRKQQTDLAEALAIDESLVTDTKSKNTVVANAEAAFQTDAVPKSKENQLTLF
jgi:sec-independent protein translocase protein TatB